MRRDDRGSALVEFSYLVVLLLIPVVYAMLAVFQVQRAAFAVSASAREAGRAYVTADSLGQARDRAAAAARITMDDHGVTDPWEVAYPDGAVFAPGAQVVVAVRARVRLPFVSALVPGDVTIPVTGEHRATVDAFRAVS